MANKELESFSYSVSHDLRAPLASMIGFCNILLEDYADKLDREGCDYLQRIKSAGSKMSRLINDILSLSKISFHDMHLENVNMSDIADEIVRELRESDPGRKIEILIDRDCHVHADAKMVGIALKNLIRNAWKYTGKVANPQIAFGSFKRESERIYFVRDNGAGFDQKKAYMLFIPFKRLHSEHDFPGTGIGLAIVERVIKRHGGKISAEGELGRGSTFYFTLGPTVL